MLSITAQEDGHAPGEWKLTHGDVDHVLSNQQHLTQHAHSVLMILLNDVLLYYTLLTVAE